MQYIVVDFEWNQASRLPGNIDPPYPLAGEIIQIGAVKLNEARHIVDRFSLMVKPVYFRVMNPNVQELTGIEGKMLDGGVPFAEAVARLREWAGGVPRTAQATHCASRTDAWERTDAWLATVSGRKSASEEGAGGGDTIWFSWGFDDRQILKENLDLFEMDKVWMEAWYDMQMIYRFQVDSSSNQTALKTAMDALELTPPDNLGEAHNAFFDAYCAGMIGGKLDLEQGIAQTKQYFLEHPPKQSSFLSRSTVRGCKNRKAAYEAGREMPLICPRCQAPLLANQPWVCEKKNQTSFATLQRCSNEECKTRRGRSEYFVRLKLIHNVSGKWQAVLLVYSATHSLIGKYVLRKRSQEKKKEAQQSQGQQSEQARA